MTRTRRNFLHTSLLLGAGSALLSACGDDDAGTDAGPSGADAGPGTDAGPSGADAGPSVDGGPAEVDAGPSDACTRALSGISANHGHELEVPVADVAAGIDVTYDIRGTSDHTHSVTVTASDFTALAAGSIMIESTSSGHTHSVMITCV